MSSVHYYDSGLQISTTQEGFLFSIGSIETFVGLEEAEHLFQRLGQWLGKFPVEPIIAAD